MGQEEANGPPKKKLKQAQLSFCSTPNFPKKCSNKRKLCEEPEGSESQQLKVVRRENDVEVSDFVSKNVTEVIEIDDESNGIEPTKNEAEEAMGSQENGNLEEAKEGKEKPNDFNVTKEVPKNSSIEKKDTNSVEIDDSLEEKSQTIVVPTPEDAPKAEEGSPMKRELFTTEKSSPKHDSVQDNLNGTSKQDDSFSENDSSVQPTSNNDNVGTQESVLTTTPKRRLTPKQLKQKAESEKKKNERLRLKEEKMKERSLLKEEKLKKKILEKEEKEKKKAEKEEEKIKEKEEKEKKRQAEMKLKEEERRRKEEVKEEEKRKREEERRRREEAKEGEKRKKEEAKEAEARKELQARAAFVSFFVPKRDSTDPGAGDEKEPAEPEARPSLNTNFMPFQVKSEMRLAEVTRTSITEESRGELNAVGKGESLKGELYLSQIRSGKRKPLSSDATWPLSALEEQHDVIIIESVEEDGEGRECEIEPEVKSSKLNHPKAKLLQFHDNRRPPYWGTWRKRTKALGPRRPFGKDNGFFDYEVDSDSEWEDEEEGESLEGGDEADKEEEEEVEGTGGGGAAKGENGYLLDNTFVPHGYLSDEEAQEADENISPEEQKLRMIVLKEQFDEEMKQKAERLKPRLLGCVWISNETTEVSSGSLYQKLLSCRAVWDESSGPIDLVALTERDSPASTPVQESKKKTFPTSVFEPLVKMVHGSHLSLSQLVKEFLSHLEKENITEAVTKHAVTRKIKDIAKRSNNSNGRQSWLVNEEFCNVYGLKNLEEDQMTPVPEVVEKPKDTFLDTFLKNQNPNSAKKRVPLITLPKTDTPKHQNSTPVERLKKSDGLVKKRVSLITLSKTPENQRQTVHQDTPRPLFNPFLVESASSEKIGEKPGANSNNKDRTELPKKIARLDKSEVVDLTDSPEKTTKNVARPLVVDLMESEEENEGSRLDKDKSKKVDPTQASISSFFKASPKVEKKLAVKVSCTSKSPSSSFDAGIENAMEVSNPTSKNCLLEEFESKKSPSQVSLSDRSPLSEDCKRLPSEVSPGKVPPSKESPTKVLLSEKPPSEVSPSEVAPSEVSQPEMPLSEASPSKKSSSKATTSENPQSEQSLPKKLLPDVPPSKNPLPIMSQSKDEVMEVDSSPLLLKHSEEKMEVEQSLSPTGEYLKKDESSNVENKDKE